MDHFSKFTMHKFMVLGPGRPSAGGPRMDRRAVTSPGVEKISRLALRLRRSAWRVQPATEGAVQNCHSQPAERVQFKSVTHSLPRGYGSKLSLTACREGAVQNCHSQPAKRVRFKTVTHSLPRGCGSKLSLTRGPKRPFKCLDYHILLG